MGLYKLLVMQKDWKEVICTSCGLVNDYTITEKSNQRVCTCNGCGRFLGNKPKDTYDVTQIRMPFGKYRGEVIHTVNDLPYFRWILDQSEMRLSNGVEAAIKFKLNIK